MANDAKIILTAEDRTKAAFSSVEGALGRLGASASAISGSLSALGGVAGVGALGVLTKNAISAMAAIDDFAEVTGVAVGEADKLYQIAKISGVELGTLQSVVLRLNKALYTSDREDSPAAAALKAIGLSFADLQKLKVDEQLRAIAQRLSEFEDGAGKTAAAMALSGKSAADALPFFNDLAEAGEVNARFTAEQAAQAEKLTKEWNRLSVEAEGLGIAIANRIVPAFNTLIDAVTRYRAASSGNLWSGLKNLAEDVVDPKSVLALQKEIADKTRDLRAAQDAGDASRENRLTGEIVQLGERLRLAQKLNDEARKAADIEAKKGSRGGVDASGMAGAGSKPRTTTRKELDAETAAVIKRYESERELQKQVEAEEERLADIRTRGLDAFIDQLEDEEKARQKANDALAETVQRYEDMADPLAVYRRELAEIDRLELNGALNADIASKARAAVSNDLQSAAERLNGTLTEQNDIGRQLGLTFSSAFEKAIIDGENLREVLQGMGRDIAQIAIRKAITEPAGNYISSLVTGAMGSTAGMSSGSSLGGTVGNSLISQGANYALGSAGGLVGVTQAFGAGMGLTAAEAAAASAAYSAAGYGATASAISGGAALGGGTAAASGIGSALSTLAAAAPYIAAVVAVVSLIAGMGKGGTPHAGAVVIGSETGSESPRTLAGFDALYKDRADAAQFYEKDFTSRYQQGVADALKPLAEGLADSFNAVTREYGAGAGFKVGVGFSSDGQDKSRGRFSIIDAAGNELTDFKKRFAKDAGKGMEQFGQAATQGLLAGLREVDLGPKINAVLDKSLQGANDLIYKLTADQTAALLSLLETGNLDELVANLDLAATSWDDINERVKDFAAIVDLKPLFDKVGVSIVEFGVDLVDAVGGAEQAAGVLQSVLDFQAVQANAANLYAASIRDIKFGTLDDPGKYAFLDEEAARLRDVLASLSDVSLIQDYAARLNDSITTAFNMLSPEQQATYADEFVKKLESASALTQQRLTVANETQNKAIEALPDKVEAAIRAGMKGVEEAIRTAVTGGFSIDIRAPAGFEVGVS